MDFRAFQWVNLLPSHDLASAIRHDVRLRRRERGRGGHRFNYRTLKSLWSADGIHAVLNHKDDSTWQLWYDDPTLGWDMVHWYGTRREAQAAAEMPHPERKTAQSSPEHGTFVLAGWPNSTHDTMKVHCSSASIADDIMAAFTAIGCSAKKEQVTALGD